MSDTPSRPDNESLESFRVRSRVEVVAILRSLIRARSRCTVLFGSGPQDVLATTLLAANPDAQELVFDCSSDAALNRRLQRASTLKFETSLDHVRVEFSTWAAESTSHDRLPALRVRLPESVVRLQRREYFRIPAPIANPLVASVPDPKDPRTILKLRLLDLSLGGLALLLPKEVTAPPLGTELEGCSLDLPDAGRILFNVSVRSVSANSRPPGTRIGCSFLRLQPHAEKAVQRQIMAMERERLARS